MWQTDSALFNFRNLISHQVQKDEYIAIFIIFIQLVINNDTKIYKNCIFREKVREWIQWRAARLQREWGALGGGAGALEQLAALATALPTRPPTQQRPALHQLRDTLLNNDVSPFEVRLHKIYNHYTILFL